MKAVLLAAGVGRRLASERPKALLRVGDRTLLERHLENLDALGIPARVVTGYHAGMVEDLLAGTAEARSGRAERVHNPAFARGSLLSLACGLEGLDEDVIVMDADVLYEPSILADVAALPRGFALDPRSDPGEEEMMLGVRDGRVRAIRRGRLAGFDLVGEGVGFCKVDRASLPALREAIRASDPDGDYERALDRFVDVHGADYVLVGERPWVEIDFPEDLERAQREILPLLATARPTR